jgi:ABC-type phosphate transport system permease subunit
MQSEIGRTPIAPLAAPPPEIDLRPRRRWGESLIQFGLWLTGVISILITLGIVAVLLIDALKPFSGSLK